MTLENEEVDIMSFFTTTSRIHMMTPDNSQNLDMFKARMDYHHSCILTAVEIGQDNQIVFDGRMPLG